MTIKDLKQVLNIINDTDIIVCSSKFGVLKCYKNYNEFLVDESLDHRVLDEEGCAVHIGKFFTDIWVEEL